MDWWQGVLIGLACVIVGGGVGYLLSYLIVTRIIKKPFARKRELTKQQFEEQAKEVEEIGKVRVAEDQERKEVITIEKLFESITPDLLAEAKNNHSIATELRAEQFLPFQTTVWDRSQSEVTRLPRNIHEDLTQAYVDMRLANSIVWLSTELGRRSNNMNENYKRLCDNIATRLNRILS